MQRFNNLAPLVPRDGEVAIGGCHENRGSIPERDLANRRASPYSPDLPALPGLVMAAM